MWPIIKISLWQTSFQVVSFSFSLKKGSVFNTNPEMVHSPGLFQKLQIFEFSDFI